MGLSGDSPYLFCKNMPIYIKIAVNIDSYAKEGMKMNKVGSYGAYQSNYYENTVQNKKESEKAGNEKTEKAKKKKPVQLSDRAKNLLKELQKTYGNMDFFVADYETDEEAAEYLSRGTKEYSVLIDPETLEEMAADEETKNKYIGMLEDATNKLNGIKEKLGSKSDEVVRLGVSLNEDGTVSYFAELEKLSEKRQEQLDKAKENKKEEKIEQERTKKAKLKADSIDELIEKIKNLNWNTIREEERAYSGSKFDCSI